MVSESQVMWFGVAGRAGPEVPTERRVFPGLGCSPGTRGCFPLLGTSRSSNPFSLRGVLKAVEVLTPSLWSFCVYVRGSTPV